MTADARLLSLLTPESRVLVLSAGGRENDARIQAELSGSIRWTLLARLLDSERATSVVWRRLGADVRARIPADASLTWQRLALVSEFQSAYLHDRLVETVRMLNREAVPVILLKGAALAEAVYGSVADRPMGDADLLVPPDRITDAWEAARRLGWVWDAERFPRSHYARHHHLPPLVDGRYPQARLELHSALAAKGHPFALAYDEALEASREATVGGVPSRVLDDRHQVVHLCVHFAWSHMLSFGAWRVFRDLHTLVSRRQIDWEAVRALASERAAAGCCHWTAALATRLVGVPIPKAFVDRLVRSPGGAIHRLLDRHLATQLFAEDRACPSELVVRRMWQLAIRPGRLAQVTGRPWDLEEAMHPEAPRSHRRRLVRHVQRAALWGRYLRVLADTA